LENSIPGSICSRERANQGTNVHVGYSTLWIDNKMEGGRWDFPQMNTSCDSASTFITSFLVEYQGERTFVVEPLGGGGGGAETE
jgi:hypothetical protein